MARDSKCPDCGSIFIALGNKKRCSACSDALYQTRKSKYRREGRRRPVAASEAAITDAARLNLEQEARIAAELWKRGMEVERRK